MTTMQKDLAFSLAEYAANLKYEDLPGSTVDMTKKDIMDTLGTALAGSTGDGVKIALDLMTDWDGKKESTVLGYGQKLPALSAAFINGTMAHARDYDDVHDRGIVHAGVSAIPSCLAVAERIGKVSGKEFITAIALGIDMMCRLGMAAGLSPATSGWHNTAIFGIFGSAAACGRLLKLDMNKMVNTFGIAYSQSSGNRQGRLEGTLTKRLQVALAVKALRRGEGYRVVDARIILK